MDPNAALARLRDYAVTILLNEDTESEEAITLAETFEGLDKWIRNGGFLPDGWDSATHPEGLNR